VNEQSSGTIRDPSTGETVSLAPLIDDLDLTTLPTRLDDTMLARVEAIARSPLPALSPCDTRHLGQALRMMLAVLPRRQADELSGELFVAAYERQLGNFPNQAITFLCDEAIKTRKWFPTVAECIEIMDDWRRDDGDTRRRGHATHLAYLERRAREPKIEPVEPWQPKPGEIEEIKRAVAESLRVRP
jgi:hypothetical protein